MPLPLPVQHFVTYEPNFSKWLLLKRIWIFNNLINNITPRLSAEHHGNSSDVLHSTIWNESSASRHSLQYRLKVWHLLYMHSHMLTQSHTLYSVSERQVAEVVSDIQVTSLSSCCFCLNNKHPEPKYFLITCRTWGIEAAVTMKSPLLASDRERGCSRDKERDEMVRLMMRTEGNKQRAKKTGLSFEIWSSHGLLSLSGPRRW